MSRRVVILSLIFSPDNVSTAQIMAGLSEDLKKAGDEVSVVTTTPHFHRDPSMEASQPIQWFIWPFLKKSDYRGVRVYHVPMPDKSIWPPLRLLSWIWFHIVSTLVCWSFGRIDALIACTPPMTIGLSAWAVKAIKRCKVVFNVQEVYPDIAINLGYMKNKRIIAFFKWLEKFIYRKSDAVTTITDGMRDKILGRTDPAKVRLIPNYVEFGEDEEKVEPLAPHKAFTVTYAGNMGVPQNLGPLVDMARKLGSGVKVLFVGDGGDRKRLQELADGLDNVEFRGYRPISEMPSIYAESDVLYVGQDEKAASDGIPSKIYRILGNRKPLVIIAPMDGDLARFIKDSGGGRMASAETLPEVIEDMRKADLKAMAERGYAYVRDNYSRGKVTGMYVKLMEELVK
ncbi:MAG: glycosyltransferase family 4 protein [Kiritimatiellae bacterium]|nr:glycosyltransferase family 4 protein [Kiritimatiellia bacterium]